MTGLENCIDIAPKSLNRKLLFVAPSAYPLGGVATWLDYLLPGLEQLGWEPTLGLVSGRHHDVDRYLEEHPYHRVLRISNPTGSHEGRVRALTRTISQSAPSIVLSVNVPDAYLAIMRLRQKGGLKAHTVMTLHGIQPDFLQDANDYRSVLDAVICTNRFTSELVKKIAKVEPSRIWYAPYGVAFPKALPTQQTFDKGRPIRIAWVGRLEHPQKRVRDLVTLLPELDRLNFPFELWVAGDGPERDFLESEIGAKPNLGRLRLLGVLSPHELEKQVYDRADALLITSSWETGPIVAWEAMAHGVPVVSSRYQGSVEEMALVHGSNCLLFDVGEMHGAARLLAAVRNPEIAATLTAGGRALVRERYTFEKSISAWDLALCGIVSRAPLAGVTRTGRITPRGRLDHICGVSMAETIRSTLGLSFAHRTAGSEWPHTLRRYQDSEFASAISKTHTG